MLFDKLCSVAEAHLPELVSLLEEINLFIFDHPAHVIKPGDTQKEEFDNFILPFQATAIEDKSSLCIILDLEPNYIGLTPPRYFIDVIPLYANTDNYNDGYGESHELVKKQAAEAGVDASCCTITFGVVSDGTPYDRGMEIAVQVHRLVMADKHRVYKDLVAVEGEELLFSNSTPGGSEIVEFPEEIHTNFLRNAVASIEELLLINTSKKFVLQTTPTKMKTSPKKIPRAHQRPLYTILDAREIRVKMGTEHEYDKAVREHAERKSPIPHERRRHPRRLTVASGYKEDKVIIIPATWIGTSEKLVGNKRYKVRLDI